MGGLNKYLTMQYTAALIGKHCLPAVKHIAWIL